MCNKLGLLQVVREEKSKHKITLQCVIEEENQRTSQKKLFAALQAEMIH